MPTFQPLTADQVNFFNTFGYLHLPGWFRDEAAGLAKAFDEQFEKHADEAFEWTHEAHYNKSRKILMRLPDRDPKLFNLLSDERIQDIANKLAGPNFIYIPSEGNIFSGDTVWHTDEYNPYLKIPDGHTYFKVALYLDPMTTQKGGFRVIPGSHNQGKFYSKLNKHLHENTAAFGLTPEQIPCVILESQPGDIVIFDHRTQHATCGTESTRRMLYFGIARNLTGEHAVYCQRIAEGLIKAFGEVYAEPLASTQDPVLLSCTQQLSNAVN